MNALLYRTTLVLRASTSSSIGHVNADVSVNVGIVFRNRLLKLMSLRIYPNKYTTYILKYIMVLEEPLLLVWTQYTCIQCWNIRFKLLSTGVAFLAGGSIGERSGIELRS
jgi:hypothetical protein